MEQERLGHKIFRVASGGIVHITDDSVIARQLKEQGEAVLVFLHAGNRDEDFSFCRYACENAADIDETYLDRVYRREKGLPLTILETERCLIRETTVADVDAFYEIYSDPAITRYMEPLYDDPEEERAYTKDYIEQVYAFYDFGIWTVLEKGNDTENSEGNGTVIGRAGICYREGYEDPELGFMIAVPWQKKGLATEVCRAILRYAEEELGFRRLLAFVQPDNEASRKVCEKVGMHEETQVCIQGQAYRMYVTEGI